MKLFIFGNLFFFLFSPISCSMLVAEKEERCIEGLGGASDSECNSGNCERELPGKCLIALFLVVMLW